MPDIEIHRNGASIVRLPTRLEFTPEQRQMIRDMYAKGADDGEFAALLEIAKARGLNPLLKQIHFVKRWDSMSGREVWAAQISIDGMRAVAERTGLYDGQDEPEFEEGQGRPDSCRVRVYKKGISRPFVGVARWPEFVQIKSEKKGGGPTHFWIRMPHIMLAKCAEAQAIRKAFPEDAAGLYVPEELPEEEEAPAPEPTRTRSEAVKKALPDASARTARLLTLSAELNKRGANPKDFAKAVLKHDRPSKDWTDAEIGLLESVMKDEDEKIAAASDEARAPGVEE